MNHVRIRRWSAKGGFLGIIAVAGVLASLFVAAGGAASSPGVVDISGSMEGALKIHPGDTVQAGYNFKIDGGHPAATVNVTNASLTFPGASCSNAAANPNLTMSVPDAIFNVGANDSGNFPSGDQSNPATWQGSLTVPANLCGGGGAFLDASKGADFQASVASTDTSKELKFQMHYRTTGSGSWSSTQAVTATQTPTTTTTPTTPSTTTTTVSTTTTTATTTVTTPSTTVTTPSTTVTMPSTTVTTPATSQTVTTPSSTTVTVPPAGGSTPPPTVAGISIAKAQRIGSGGTFTRAVLTAQVGETIEYRITVRNTGDVSLVIVLTDGRCDSGTITPAGAIMLAPGALQVYRCSHVVASADPGRIVNTAIAAGTTPSGAGVGPVSSSVSARKAAVLAKKAHNVVRKAPIVRKAPKHKVAKKKPVAPVKHVAPKPKAVVKPAQFTG